MQSFLTSTRHFILCPILLYWLGQSHCEIDHKLLVNRKQKLVVNGAVSESVPVLSRVPQGSVPYTGSLFFFYVDGVLNLPVTEVSQLVLYTDDSLLY